MNANCPFCEQLDRLHELPSDQLVGQFRQSYVLLAPWQYYKGYCILVSRHHATELFQLSNDVRQELIDEITILARVIFQEWAPRKINYELLGNQVPHIHWHIIPRYETDPEHLKPAWVALDRAERDNAMKSRLLGTVDRQAIADRIRRVLWARP